MTYLITHTIRTQTGMGVILEEPMEGQLMSTGQLVKQILAALVCITYRLCRPDVDPGREFNEKHW